MCKYSLCCLPQQVPNPSNIARMSSFPGSKFLHLWFLFSGVPFLPLFCKLDLDLSGVAGKQPSCQSPWVSLNDTWQPSCLVSPTTRQINSWQYHFDPLAYKSSDGDPPLTCSIPFQNTGRWVPKRECQLLIHSQSGSLTSRWHQNITLPKIPSLLISSLMLRQKYKWQCDRRKRLVSCSAI